MGTPWTDESAILRDLSFAQGRWVPGGINSAVAGAKPPAHNIKEETEEEFYRRWASVECVGTGDFSAGPDLYHIKTMLELVHDEEAPEEIPYTSGPIEIRKLNTRAKTFVPNKHKSKENIKPNKPRRARNVAIASIMSLALTQESPKLAKPEDFIKCKEDMEVIERRKDSVNKVTNWLQSQDMSSMFKKKCSIQSFKEDQRSSMKDSKISPSRSEDSVKSPSGQYTPSRWAAEYYEKALDRTRVRDILHEDVWGRAERIMKEIDAQKEMDAQEELRKQKEAELAAENAERNEDGERDEAAGADAAPATAPDDDEVEGIAKILLPLSRHSLQRAAACVVCRVLCVCAHTHTHARTHAQTHTPSGQEHAPSTSSNSEYTLVI